jgi:hypothetical protein
LDGVTEFLLSCFARGNAIARRNMITAAQKSSKNFVASSHCVLTDGAMSRHHTTLE